MIRGRGSIQHEMTRGVVRGGGKEGEKEENVIAGDHANLTPTTSPFTSVQPLDLIRLDFL